MTENSSGVKHKGSPKIIPQFRKLVFGGLLHLILTHPGGFHLLGICYHLKKCRLCFKESAQCVRELPCRMYMKGRKAAQPVFAAVCGQRQVGAGSPTPLTLRCKRSHGLRFPTHLQ